MTTKKLNIVFEEVKVVKIDINLGNLEQYKSRFLALKNHERETKKILRVRGFYDSSEVQVVLLIEDDEPEADELARCTEWAGQFGEITECNVETAYILDESFNELDWGGINGKDWYVYGQTTMCRFTLTNTTTGRAAEIAVANVSRKFRREYNAGEMPVSQFAFYLDGKSDEAHRTLHALGIKDYTELAIAEIK